MTPKIQSILEQRFPVRFGDEWTDSSKDLILELSETIHDRLCLRLNCSDESFPLPFVSILIDATVKAYRRLYYENVNSENVDNIQNSFFEDLLNEYTDEINSYRTLNADANTSTNKVVRFL